MSDPIQHQALGGSVRGIALAAIVEAQRQGVALVEAEHLLLALAGDQHTPTGRFLAEHGLDHASCLAALRTERERSLQAVGVAPRDSAALAATRIQRPRWGASARVAFERTQKLAPPARRGPHRTTGFGLLCGILGLELGTVPRALAFAGIDREAMLSAALEESGMGGTTRTDRAST